MIILVSFIASLLGLLADNIYRIFVGNRNKVQQQS